MYQPFTPTDRAEVLQALKKEKNLKKVLTNQKVHVTVNSYLFYFINKINMRDGNYSWKNNFCLNAGISQSPLGEPMPLKTYNFRLEPVRSTPFWGRMGPVNPR
jgi:hypothetical protein